VATFAQFAMLYLISKPANVKNFLPAMNSLTHR